MLKPLRNQVIVKPSAETNVEKVVKGIVIPGTVVESKLKEGVVVAVGPGYMFDTGVLKVPDVKVGDEVFYGSGFIEHMIDGEKHLIMSDENINMTK